MTKKVIPPSELIINPDGSVFHLHLRPDQLTDRIILVGDPARVDLVAGFFDTQTFEVSSREFHTIGGTYKGKPIMCLSHGIGPDNIDIVINELDALANVDFTTREVKDEKRSLTMVRMEPQAPFSPNLPSAHPLSPKSQSALTVCSTTTPAATRWPTSVLKKRSVTTPTGIPFGQNPMLSMPTLSSSTA